MTEMIISAESQSALDELLVAARRERMSPDEVADRLEMVAYFHRDVLKADALDGITTLFESTLRDIEQSYRELEGCTKMSLVVRRIELALEQSLEEIARMQRRARDLQHSIHEGVLLASVVANPARLVHALPRLSNTLVQHGVQLAEAEASVLADQGVREDDVRKLMGLPRSIVGMRCFDCPHAFPGDNN